MFMYLFSEILTDMKFLEIAQRYTDYRKLAFALGLTTDDIRHAQKINETYKDPTDITLTILEVCHKNSHLMYFKLNSKCLFLDVERTNIGKQRGR